MKKRLTRITQSRQHQQDLDAEIDHRILADLQLQKDDHQWNRVRADFLEYPMKLRRLRNTVIGEWQLAIAQALPDDHTPVGDALTNEELDKLLQQTIRTVIPEVLRHSS